MKERELEIDPRTSELKAAFTSIEDVVIYPRFFGACNGRATNRKDRIEINSSSKDDKRKIDVETMHISCKSDTYQSGHNYAGVIIYQYDEESDWRTANNTHCKAGYIVIQDTDSKGVKQWKNEPGAVHGAVYRNAFGESVKEKAVVGEGFAIINGAFRVNSGVFNNEGSEYHDKLRSMHELSEHCVGKIVEYWKSAGPSWIEQRNFEVKELLEGFDQ